MSEASLVCSCGLTLKLAGARPGRVGKCPQCGAVLRVPDDFGAEKAGPALETPAEGAFVEGRRRPRPAGSKDRRTTSADDHGPLKPPRELETWFYQSLLYPLWAWSSIALLIFLPPIMTVVLAPLPFVYGIVSGGTPFTIAGLVMALPLGFGGIVVFGYLLIYLSHVLTSSCFGDRLPPRSPNFQDDDIFRLLFRWICALFGGLVVGFVPAVAYWIECGEVDWADRIMLLNLFVVGIAYAQMALLAALLHDDPLAANPITVIRALVRVGLDYVAISLLAAAWVGVIAVFFALIQEVKSGIGHLLLTWFFWLVFLYTALVLLRCQGLFSRRHRVMLDWFPDRPTWGR